MKAGIYGAGKYGQQLLSIFNFVGISIDSFIQSKQADEREYVNGLPVLGIEELLEKKEKYLIFIAISDAMVVAEIERLLESRNYDMTYVFDMHGFIDDNENHRRYVRPGGKECLLCGQQLEKFEGAGEKKEIFLEKKIIGGGYRENAVCPYCGAMDRTRWLYWVIKEQTDMLKRKCTVIHFAPEKSLRKMLVQTPDCDYYPCDFCMEGLPKVDVTNMIYKDHMADFIIINHVLEHVKNEEKAVSELKRVLKEDGKLIMSFPICTEQKTYEDETVISEADKEKYYGQKDHVRLYGTDFKERFENYGLRVQIYSPKDYLTSTQIERYGLIKDDIIMVCSKKVV